MSTITHAITFEEFEKLPETPGKLELLDGEVIELPPAKLSHMALAKRFWCFLSGTTGASRAWIETGYRIRGGWLIPDVSVAWPEQKEVDGYLAGSPMIAVEIASPSNTAWQFDAKVAAYLDDGAAEVWVVFPEARRMTVHARADMSVRRYTSKYECALLETTVPVDELLGD